MQPSIISVEHGGWTLAIRTKRGCRRVFSAATTSKCRANFDGRNVLAKGTMDGDEGTQAVVDQLAIRMERFKLRMPHKFLHTILCFIRRVLRNCPLAVIRAFGIGPIETGISTAYQLILLEAIKDHFAVPMVTSQDPVTTLSDKRYLEGRSIAVLPPDDLLSAPPIDVGPSEFTLLYMIHCTAEMYDNVLSYYSSNHRLQNIILFGNDPNHSIATSVPTSLLSSPVKKNCTDTHHHLRSSSSSGSVSFPHLAEFACNSVSFQLPYFEPSEIAFNFTSISFLDVDTDVIDNEDVLRKIIA